MPENFLSYTTFLKNLRKNYKTGKVKNLT